MCIIVLNKLVLVLPFVTQSLSAQTACCITDLLLLQKMVLSEHLFRQSNLQLPTAHQQANPIANLENARFSNFVFVPVLLPC